MGKSMSAIKEAKHEQNVELEERLNFLETTTTEKMKVKLQQMLHGSDNDLQIHGGTVVEQHIRVKIDASSDEKELESAIDELFRGDFIGGIKNIAKQGLQSILGNTAVGECEQQA